MSKYKQISFACYKSAIDGEIWSSEEARGKGRPGSMKSLLATLKKKKGYSWQNFKSYLGSHNLFIL